MTKVGRDIDDHSTRVRADEIVLLGVAVEQCWYGLGAAKHGKALDESLDIRGEIQWQVTSIDCGAKPWPHPPLNVELEPAIRFHRAVVLSKRSEEAVKGKKSKNVCMHPMQHRKRATDRAPVLIGTSVRRRSGSASNSSRYRAGARPVHCRSGSA